MPTVPQTIEVLEDSLADVQQALVTAQHVLQVADTTARNVRRARKTMRRGLIVLVGAAIVAGVVIAVRRRSAQSQDLDAG